MSKTDDCKFNDDGADIAAIEKAVKAIEDKHKGQPSYQPGTTRITIRMSQLERAVLQHNADVLGMSLGGYFKRVAMRGKVSDPLFAANDALKISTQLSILSRDTNEIAHTLHSLRIYRDNPSNQDERIVAQYEQVTKEIRALRKLIQDNGQAR